MKEAQYQALINPKLSLSQEESLLFLHNENFPTSFWRKKYLHGFFEQKKRTPILVCATDNEQLVGFVCGRFEKENNKNFVLTSLIIDSKYRGNSYGKKMAKRFIEFVFKNTKAAKIVLHYRDGNNLASYYSTLGFKNHCICGRYKNNERKHYMDMARSDIM